MIVRSSTRDSRTTGLQAAATRRSSLVGAAKTGAWSVPDISHEPGIEGPQSWVWPMTVVDSVFSVPVAKAARSTSIPPAITALAQIIDRVWRGNLGCARHTLIGY